MNPDVITLMESSLQAIRDKLNEWSSPYLRKCSFACVAMFRDNSMRPTARDLDCVLSELSRKLDFPGVLIPGEQFVAEWPEEPDEGDFATADEFDAAYDAFWPKIFDPKPWLIGDPKTDVERALADSMTWSINNKRYELSDAHGQRKRYVAYSHQDDEKRVIGEQELQHQSMVDEYSSTAARFFVNDDYVSLYRSNHQLNTDMDDAVAECYEGCFFDRTLAFVSDTRLLMVWIGHLRWYG